MDLFDAIRGRKSIRKFKDLPVPDEDVRKILDAGRRAPSANNTQPWSFLVIRDKAVLKQMAEAVRLQVDRMIPFAENDKQAQRLAAYKTTFYTFFENAPLVIAVFTEAYDASTNQLLARMGYSPPISCGSGRTGAPERRRGDRAPAARCACPGLRLLLDDRTAGGAGIVREDPRLRQGQDHRRAPSRGHSRRGPACQAAEGTAGPEQNHRMRKEELLMKMLSLGAVMAVIVSAGAPAAGQDACGTAFEKLDRNKDRGFRSRSFA